MKRAFSLLEMTVVLAIIALLTHLAVLNLGEYRNKKLEKEADRHLSEIKEAAERFLHDVGRLPRLQPHTNSLGRISWTLSELWEKPSHLDYCHLVRKDSVSFAVGWNGPYLKMPFGANRLLDPWGNELELEDSAHLKRLWADAQDNVTNICHYGSSGREVDKKSLSLIPNGGLVADLILTVDAASYDGDIRCSWYGAYENVLTNDTQIIFSGSQAVFRNVPCGPKAIKIVTSKETIRFVDVKGPVMQIGFKVQ